MVSRSVTSRVFPFVFTVDPGTNHAAPETLALAVPDTIFRNLELVIPAGHTFLTGFALFQQGQQILPWPSQYDWITDNDKTLNYPMGFEVDGVLEARGYNEDIFIHQFWLRLTLDDIALPGAGVAPTPNALVL